MDGQRLVGNESRTGAPSHDLDGFGDLPMAQMADQIIARHHLHLRRDLPRLKQLLDRAVVESGGRCAELRVLKDTFDQFYHQTLLHLDREEQVLFPLIQRLDLASTRPGFYGGELETMMEDLHHDHDLAESAFLRFRNLTDNYKPPVGGCAPYREFVAALAGLEADTQLHTLKEDHYLFPRARAAVKALLAPRPQPGNAV